MKNIKSIKKSYHSIFMVTFIVLANTLFVNAQSKTSLVDHFTDKGYSNAVGTTQHPAGEYYKGVTYVAYQGPLEDPYVAAYDHATKKWIGPFKAGVSLLGKNPDKKNDNHGKPALIIDDEGYIHVVFGGHGGLDSHGENTLGNTHLGKMIHVVSKKPLDISSWEVLENIPPFGTYNQLVKMDNGDIYLFYRHGAHRSNWVYQKSTDNARSFDAPVSVLKTKRRSDNLAVDAWYGWFEKAANNKIIAGYNYHHCKDEDDNHDGERHNGYYMVMDTKNHKWYNVQGKKLTVPVTKEHADKMTLVVDTGDSWTVRGTAALDKNGNPHVTYTVGEHLGLIHGGPKQIQHFRWTGKNWTDGVCANLPVATGDMDLSVSGKISLLLASKTKDKKGEISWYHSKDDGVSFQKGTTLLRRKKMGFTISSMIRNAHPDAQAIVMGKVGNSDYGKMYLLGDNGPVQREKSEANQLTAAEKAQPKKSKKSK
tara:strand:+ start:30357 stop:31796 length:1440 start_codon:yes stop_codon:yes gene_type:complete